MDFDGSIIETKDVGSGIELRIYLSRIKLADSVAEKDAEKLQPEVDTYNINLERLHLGAIQLRQVLDSSEILLATPTQTSKDEAKKPETKV